LYPAQVGGHTQRGLELLNQAGSDDTPVPSSDVSGALSDTERPAPKRPGVVHLQVCVRDRLERETHTHIHSHKHTNTQTHTHTNTNTHKHTHTHTHTHTRHCRTRSSRGRNTRGASRLSSRRLSSWWATSPIRRTTTCGWTSSASPRCEREFSIDNLLVRVHHND